MKNRLAIFTLFAALPLLAQDAKPQNDMPGMDMSGQSTPAQTSPATNSPAVSNAAANGAAPSEDAPKSDSSDMHDMPGMGGDSSAHAMQSMEGHHMDMGPHMKMTALRELKSGDQQKADQVAEAARKVAEKYTDYKVALADGFKIFHPEVPQKQYHFTNYWYAFEASMRFNPDHPTSLLYEKQGDGYKLIGVMYTAPKNASEDQLDQRIPLSIAQWHAHVNLCLPPAGHRGEAMGPNAKYGLRGSITTKSACDAADGKFIPQIFGWMVHVYPFEKDGASVWSVERQAPGQAHMD
ncbi:MAG TPA: hypothetical protein VLW84_07005 [Terriglobales bacterium]|nr:hypothetical protein [Terriglobales bacterium]